MALGLIPFFNFYAKLAAFFMGAAVLAEGVTRLIEDRLANADVCDGNVVPSLGVSSQFANDAMLGDLKAVFRTKNNPLDTVTISFVAAAMASGAGWAFEWLLGGGVGGAAQVKLGLCACALPLLIGYSIYRAVQLLADKRTVYVHERGVRWVGRNEKSSLLWEQVSEFKAIHVGDMFDEDAIEVLGPIQKLRVTRGHYALFEECWIRIQQEAAEYVESGKIQVRVKADPTKSSYS